MLMILGGFLLQAVINYPQNTHFHPSADRFRCVLCPVLKFSVNHPGLQKLN